MAYDWNFQVVMSHPHALISGAAVTLEIAALTILFGTAFGFLFYLLKDNGNEVTKKVTSVFIEFFRDIPILVLIIWLFYAITPLLNIRVNAFWTSVIGMSLVLGAFSSEIFRSGFGSIPKGQTEAGRSIGMNRFQILRHVVFPQALKTIIPPLTGRYIETIKLTSLASVIAVNELLHEGQNLISVSFRPLEVYTVIALIYLLMIIPMNILLRRLERKYVTG